MVLRRSIIAYWLLLMGLSGLHCSVPCAAAAMQQERRAVCGAYSYNLPKGFTAVDVPQPYADSVYLYVESELSPPNNSVTCIQKKTNSQAKYILETVDVLAPQNDADVRMRIVRHTDQFRPDVRAYYISYLHDGHVPVPWSRFLLEMDAQGTGEHIIVYLYEATPYRDDPTAGPNAPPIPIASEELRQRAADLIRSIRKDR